MNIKIEQSILEDITKMFGRYWTEIRFELYGIVMDYGVIHSNGMHERAIGTIAYRDDGSRMRSVHV